LEKTLFGYGICKRVWRAEVYKLARKLSKDIFEASKMFPKEEMYSLTNQIRRSSRSIVAQIAEAWGKRKYEKLLTNYLLTNY